MKKIKLIVFAASAIFAAGCSSTNHAGSSNPDDVYYSGKSSGQAPQAQSTPAPAPQPNDYSSSGQNYDQGTSNSSQNNTPDYVNPSSSQSSTDGNGNTYITNNYYNDDDYYDYAYSARLRRYYSPVYGAGYYDPFYTNRYWYDYNPVSWGVSIYLGYNWWAPSFYYSAPFCYGGFGIGFGYGYHPFYSPWSSPWYSPYSPYAYGYPNSYYSGYNNGYYDGFNDGYYGGGGYYNPYYYNSYDGSSTTYYGPRGSGSGGNTSGGRLSTNSPVTLGERYQQAASDGSLAQLSTGGRQVHMPATSSFTAAKPELNQPKGNSINLGNAPRNTTTSPAPVQLNDGKNNPTSGRPAQAEPSKGIISIKNESNQGKNTNDKNPVQNPKPELNLNQPGGRTNSANEPQFSRPSDNEMSKPNSNPSPTFQQGGRTNEPRVNSSPDIQTPGRNNNTQPASPNLNVPRDNGSRPGRSEPNYQQTPEPRNNNSPKSQQEYSAPRMNTPMQQESPAPSPNLNRPGRSNNNMTEPPRQSRQESRAPVFQPRNEPKQFRQEAPAPREQRSSPAPSQSRPSPSQESHGRGGRR